MGAKKGLFLNFSSLLKKDRKILIVGLFFLLSLMVSVVFLYSSIGSLVSNPLLVYSNAQSIQKISRELGVSPKALKKELNLDLNVSGRIPIYQFGVSQTKLNFVANKAVVRSNAKNLKAALFFLASSFGLMVLLYSSIRNQAETSSAKNWSIQIFYVSVLGLMILLGGFVLGKSLNPMESVVKVIKILSGHHAGSFSLMLLILFIIFSIIGNKIICGWACPFGALQELIYIFSSRIKKHIPPFWITNTIRAGILLLSLLMLFGWFGSSGAMLYHKINPFNIFVPYFKVVSIGISIFLFLATSLFLYRPFCQLICPFGLLTWVLEKISIFKIRIDPKKCVKCKKCYGSCPTGAIKNKVEGKTIPKECFSCGRCLEECPFKAINYN